MPYGVLSALFGMISSFFATKAAVKRKEWISALYRGIILLTSIIGFVAALNAYQKRNAAKKQSTAVAAR